MVELDLHTIDVLNKIKHALQDTEFVVNRINIGDTGAGGTAIDLDIRRHEKKAEPEPVRQTQGIFKKVAAPIPNDEPDLIKPVQLIQPDDDDDDMPEKVTAEELVARGQVPTQEVTNYSDAEIELIRKLCAEGKTLKEIQAAFPQRSPLGIRAKVHGLGLVTKSRKQDWGEFKYRRLHYFGQEVNKLMYAERISYQEAHRKVDENFREYPGKQIKVLASELKTVNEQFIKERLNTPMYPSNIVADESLDLLKVMIHEAIVRGKPYRPDTAMLHFLKFKQDQEYNTWNEQTWHAVLAEMMLRGRAVAEYMQVPNKFKIEQTPEGEALAYG